MPEQTIKLLVEGGKANPAALGQSLGAAGLNIGKVVAEVNAKTKEYVNMKVPVEIIYDDKKNFKLAIGVPPVSQLLKKEAKIESGAGDRKAPAGNITMDQVIKVTKQKNDQMMSTTLKDNVKEVLGIALSMGLNVEGKSPKEVTKEVNEGKYDAKLK